MKLKNKKVGFVFTNVLKVIDISIEQMRKIKNMSNDIYPIMSFNAYRKISNNRKKEIENITNNKIVHDFNKIDMVDIMVIEPCSGNTLSKLANNIIDTPALYIANYMLSFEKPLVIGITSFNGISYSLENIGKIIRRKNIFFIPFLQTNPITKPDYICCNFNLTIETLEYGLDKTQINPIFM